MSDHPCRRHRRRFHPPSVKAVVALLLFPLMLLVNAQGASAAGAQGGSDPAPAGGRTVLPAAPSAATDPKGGPSDGALREAVEDIQRGERPDTDDGQRVRAGQLQVEVLHSLGTGAASGIIRSVGGEVTGSAGETLLEAWVPFDRIEELEGRPGVQAVRQVQVANAPDAGNAIKGTRGVEAVSKTAADAWHVAGFTGAGVKVGIVDFFDGATWVGAAAAGELPTGPAGTFCRSQGTACDIWASKSKHGSGVAEVIHDIAPGSPLYVATASSASDLRAAVDWFAANGVKVISRSLTAEYDGPGNGTGAMADVVNYAVSKGITWFNSAGNSAGTSFDPGSYWRGTWRDANANGYLDFSPGDELLAFDCAFMNGVRWSDWGTGRTDYDVHIYDDAAATVLENSFTADQPAGAPPIENAFCNGNSSDIDYLAISLYAPGTGTAGDILEFMTNGASIEYPSNPYSATGPVADTNNSGAVVVGAVDPWNGTSIGSYSSQGPTNDGRTKPDLSAVSCMTSYSYSPGCFNGTSAATPAAAAAGALALQRWTATSPAQLKTWLLGSAVVDRGIAGRDNVFGAGELRLPQLSPTVSSLSPTSGTAGSTVRISGANLTGATAVQFNGQGATFTINSSSQITATVPAFATTGPVTVTTPSGTIQTTSSFTVTSPSIRNGGFENGSANVAPWVAPAGVIDNSTSRPARTGAWKAWLNGFGSAKTETLYQDVTIPAGVSSATLSAFVRIDTAETTTAAVDVLSVQVRNTSNAVLKTLGTLSNLNKSTGYVERTYDVSAYRGQTVRIYFSGTENSALQTSFVIDDVSLRTQYLGNGGFENGSANVAPWVAPAGVIDNSTSRPARTGAWKAWLNGFGSAKTETLYQDVTIPAGVSSATLSAFVRIDTAETTTAAVDVLSVQVRNTSNAVLKTLGTLSNLNKSTGYLERTYDVSAYRGQTVRIYFSGTENSALQTSFVIDDVSLRTQ